MTDGPPPERSWEDRNPFRPERPSPQSRQSGFQRYRMFLIMIAAFILIAVVRGAFTKVDAQGAQHGRFVVFSNLLAEQPGKPRLVPALAVVPAGGGEARPLLVLIAGRDQTLETLLEKGFYASLAQLGLQAPDIAVLQVDPDSGAHDTSNGKWGSYLLQEAIPAALKQTGADPKRVAIAGFGLGGFGALDLAGANPDRFCVVGGQSPELWERFGDARPGFFDDAADFARHDLLGQAEAGSYPGTAPLRIDVGVDDPQLPLVRRLVKALQAGGRTVDFHELQGRDSPALWQAQSGNLLRFYATQLHACTR